MRIDALHPSELSAAQAETWRGVQARRRALASPFLSPDWAQAVARAQGPVAGLRVVSIDDAAFFAAKVGTFTGMPVGAPLCDYQAVIADEGAALPEARAVLKALGVQRQDFSHLICGDPVFGGGVEGSHPSYVVDLDRGWAAYEAETRTKSDVLKDMARKRRKIEREVGEVRFTALSDSEADFRTLLGWKRDQYQRTRQTDVLARPWVMRLMEDLWERRAEPFGGALYTLHIGGQLAAAQFNLRGPGVVNAWFIGHGCAFERYSPGLVMFGDLLRWMADESAAGQALSLDLGPIAYRFKDRIANRTTEIGWGFCGMPAPATLVRAAEYGVRRAAEALPLGRASQWPGKAMRRLDLLRALA
ncbi:MAG TPA: GNAT family N-acetyltransferase [Caulobacteraceae bacterium]|jgi:CelD/BcsL family acetyltransferase involved in cellulose biosynthesis